MRRSLCALALFFVTTAASPGCGNSGSGVKVSGKLLKAGTPYVPPKGQTVNVTLVLLESHDPAGKTAQSGEPYWADVDQTNGTFTVKGAERQGVPPGKYRVAVTQKMLREAFNAANPKPKSGGDREADMLGNKFGPGTSPIIREVKSGEELVIDLDKPSG